MKTYKELNPSMYMRIISMLMNDLDHRKVIADNERPATVYTNQYNDGYVCDMPNDHGGLQIDWAISHLIDYGVPPGIETMLNKYCFDIVGAWCYE